MVPNGAWCSRWSLVVRGIETGEETNHRVVFVFVCLFFVQQGDALEASGIRVEVDNRMNKTAGWKMTHWEQKGVPLRLEIGSNEMASESLVACRRHNNAKVTIAMSDVVAECHQLLADIHDSMLDTARQDRDAHLSIVTTWEEFLVEIERKPTIVVVVVVCGCHDCCMVSRTNYSFFIFLCCTVALQVAMKYWHHGVN